MAPTVNGAGPSELQLRGEIGAKPLQTYYSSGLLPISLGSAGGSSIDGKRPCMPARSLGRLGCSCLKTTSCL
jgi:hypothetical protein